MGDMLEMFAGGMKPTLDVENEYPLLDAAMTRHNLNDVPLHTSIERLCELEGIKYPGDHTEYRAGFRLIEEQLAAKHG